LNKNLQHELQEHLSELSAKGARELRMVRADATLAIEAKRALPMVWAIPAVYVLARFALGPEGLPGPGTIALAMVLAPAAWLAFHAARAALLPMGSRAPLVAIDRHLGLKDRLATSAEFLEQEQRGSFAEAALEDGLDAARLARAGDLNFARQGWHPGEETAPHLVAAALLFLVALFLGSTFMDTEGVGDDGALTDQVASLDQGPEITDPKISGKQDETALPEPEQAQKDKEDSAPAKESEKASELSKETKPSEGKTGSGKSSDAQSQTAASESRGAPSGQTPAPPKDKAKKTLESKTPKKKKASEDKPRKPKDDEDQGGSTAGRGSAKGSNRNTTTSKWSSKDQVTTPDEQEIEEDEDTEDEQEEQENRGGMQPNLRDRRPPVSRDLRIGFGNQPSPDANGRGGPSEAKKSRGTASLVLGVPIPDRIKGQPNPGPTRITQERIEPTAEDPTPETARAQSNRVSPIGQVTKPSPPTNNDNNGGNLAPWMSKLVKTYFTTRRQKVNPTNPVE
jgi:hypothetical protein